MVCVCFAAGQNLEEYCNLPELQREWFTSLRIDLNDLAWCPEKKRKKIRNSNLCYTEANSTPRTRLNLYNPSVYKFSLILLFCISYINCIYNIIRRNILQ